MLRRQESGETMMATIRIYDRARETNKGGTHRPDFLRAGSIGWRWTEQGKSRAWLFSLVVVEEPHGEDSQREAREQIQNKPLGTHERATGFEQLRGRISVSPSLSPLRVCSTVETPGKIYSNFTSKEERETIEEGRDHAPRVYIRYLQLFKNLSLREVVWRAGWIEIRSDQIRSVQRTRNRPHNYFLFPAADNYESDKTSVHMAARRHRWCTEYT